MKLPIGKFSLGNLPLGKLSGMMARKGDAPAAATPPAGAATAAKSRRIPVNKATVALGSGVIIFAVSFAMQNFGSHPGAGPVATPNKVTAKASPEPTPLPQVLDVALDEALDVAEITPTSFAFMPKEAALPELPQAKIVASKPDMTFSNFEAAVLKDADTPMPLQAGTAIGLPQALVVAFDSDAIPSEPVETIPGLPCDITLTADPAPAAMVDLIVDASCLPSEQLTLHHNGMMFHAMTDDRGRANLRVPALAKKSVFIASFESGEGAVAQIDVPMIDFYDRVVVQWRGDSGLGLHALEFDAAYFGAGHIHNGAPGDVGTAASGTSGFLTHLGEGTGPQVLNAEIYSFPTRTAQNAGRIGLSVEAEVTADNCGTEIEAQTLQLKPGTPLRTQDVTLYMPDCEASGDFLVLNNLLEDLKVAAN
ncbi:MULTISPECIES: translocase [unclassified Marinovum]